MEIAEVIKKAFQEWVVPELSAIRSEIAEVKGHLAGTNERLRDLQTQLTDLSRRVDEVRSELSGRIDEVRSELSGRIEEFRAELSGRIDETNRRIDETNRRIDEVRTELTGRIETVRTELAEKIESVRTELTERIEDLRSDLTVRHDQLNLRMDEMGRAIVRRDEYDRVLRHMEHRLTSMEHEVNDLKRRVAA